MKRVAILLLLVMLLSACQTLSDSVRDDVAAARQAYQAGDLADTVGLAQTAVESGARQPDVFVLLGHAYAQQEDWGRALLSYLRALEIVPRDYSAQLGAALVRAQRIDIQGDDSAPLASISALTAGWLSQSELAWLAFGLFAALLVLGVRWSLSPQKRPALRRWLFAAGLIFAVLAALSLTRTAFESSQPRAVLVAFEADVLSGNAADRAVLFRLHNAAEFREAERRAEWARIVLPDGREGWLPLSSFERIVLP